jgi:RNA polymerase sigma-70 factor (ECF subfamily)
MLMPPLAAWFDGRDAVVTASMLGLSTMTEGSFRMVETGANRQPAVAGYYREPRATHYSGLVLNVLRVEDGQLTDIVGFPPQLFPAFGLPPTL